jgi:uncharacterized RmlC-like cupin family protein
MSSSNRAGRDIVTVRSGDAFANRQKLNLFEGISDRTCGSRGISMYKVVIPPGGCAEPHAHRGYETAIFVLKGEIETRYGDGLAKKVVNVAGDFLFIPADVPHQPVNIGTEIAEAIVARNDASEQENVAPYVVD